MPGKTDAHHWPLATCPAPARIIAPHSGVGTWIPTPTNANDAVILMAHDTRIADCTRMGGSALGRTCLTRMRQVGLPTERADSMYVDCLMCMVSARINRV